MTETRSTISHVVLNCFDLDRMIDFFTGTLGFHLSDRGMARGNRICFLTLDPESDHHQIALAAGRTGPRDAGSLNHIAFRVPTLADLKSRYRRLREAQVPGIDPITHGSWLSVYYRDPENNRLEFFWDTPWYVQQPIVEPLDLERSDEDILQGTLDRFGNTPNFCLMKDWKAETARRRALA